MNELNGLDLKSFINKVVIDVFDTMLSMDVEETNSDFPAAGDEDKIVGMVSFVGKAMGSTCILVNETFAHLITAAMLGMELDEIEGDEEVFDVLGELSNMIGGDMKSRLCDAGFNCDLSVPSITKGKDFEIEPTDWTRHEKIAFSRGEDIILVELYLKSGN